MNLINDNLEQQAQAIFKSWFVDFELRDLNGDTINASLETLIDFDPNNKVVKNEQYAFYDMKCLSASNMCLGTGTRRLPGSSSSFRNNDTLLAKITPCLENGKTGFVFGLSEDEVACGSTEFIVMRSKGVVSPYWIYCLARDDKFRDTAIKSMIGSSGRQRVQSQVLKQYEMGFSQSAMCNFHTTTEPIFNTIATNHKESFTLIRLRDALQPKLMSGELSVEEAERKL